MPPCSLVLKLENVIALPLAAKTPPPPLLQALEAESAGSTSSVEPNTTNSLSSEPVDSSESMSSEPQAGQLSARRSKRDRESVESSSQARRHCQISPLLEDIRHKSPPEQQQWIIEEQPPTKNQSCATMCQQLPSSELAPEMGGTCHEQLHLMDSEEPKDQAECAAIG